MFFKVSRWQKAFLVFGYLGNLYLGLGNPPKPLINHLGRFNSGRAFFLLGCVTFMAMTAIGTSNKRSFVGCSICLWSFEHSMDGLSWCRWGRRVKRLQPVGKKPIVWLRVKRHPTWKKQSLMLAVQQNLWLEAGLTLSCGRANFDFWWLDSALMFDSSQRCCEDLWCCPALIVVTPSPPATCWCRRHVDVPRSVDSSLCIPCPSNKTGL